MAVSVHTRFVRALLPIRMNLGAVYTVVPDLDDDMPGRFLDINPLAIDFPEIRRPMDPFSRGAKGFGYVEALEDSTRDEELVESRGLTLN